VPTLGAPAVVCDIGEFNPNRIVLASLERRHGALPVAEVADVAHVNGVGRAGMGHVARIVHAEALHQRLDIRRPVLARPLQVEQALGGLEVDMALHLVVRQALNQRIQREVEQRGNDRALQVGRDPHTLASASGFGIAGRSGVRQNSRSSPFAESIQRALFAGVVKLLAEDSTPGATSTSWIRIGH
jgi:hypothetical protein